MREAELCLPEPFVTRWAAFLAHPAPGNHTKLPSLNVIRGYRRKKNSDEQYVPRFLSFQIGSETLSQNSAFADFKKCSNKHIIKGLF